MALDIARVFAVLTLFAVVSPGTLHAQGGAPTRQELDPAGRSQRLAPPAPDLFSNPGAGACPLAENPAPLTVRSVTLRGLVSVPAAELQSTFADLVNKPGDAADLCKIRDRVAEALFDRGLLARVEIPAQTIDDGAVTLEVVEAHIVNVTVRGDPGAAGPLLEQYAQRLRGMAPFDVNQVQRYILLASDVPGLSVRATVRPNTDGQRGAVDLDLNVEHNPQDLTVNIQNAQARTTGRFGGLLRYDFNARTRFGEQTSVVLYRTLRDEQWVLQGVEEIRLGSEGLMLRGSLAYGESHPGDVLKPLGIKSKSLVASVEANYPLIRKRRLNVRAAAGLELINQDTGAAGSRLINDDLRVVYARVAGDRTSYWGGIHPVTVSGQATLRQGVTVLGATDQGDRLLSRGDARPGTWVAAVEARAFTLISPRLSLQAGINGQYADRPLTAYEEYAVGPFSIGRGYDPAYVSGDRALAASVEAHSGPFTPRSGWAFSPYAFFDIAHVQNLDRGGGHDTVKSVGAGFQIPLRDRWVMDAAYARPLDRRAFDRKRPSGRLLMSLTARFY